MQERLFCHHLRKLKHEIVVSVVERHYVPNILYNISVEGRSLEIRKSDTTTVVVEGCKGLDLRTPAEESSREGVRDVGQSPITG